MNCALHLCKRPAVEFTAWLETNVRGGDFKADPLAEFGQFALELVGDVISTCVECLVGAPRRTVIPLAVIKLQLDCLGRVLWIEIDVSKQP